MKLNLVEDNFFVAGGTLRPGTPSYVKRPADDELFKWASAGELCYVLTPRQMGKSSLMVRTSRRLEENGIRTVKIDLTGIGTLVSIDVWYTSFLTQISDSLKLNLDVSLWLNERNGLSYVHRLSDFISEIVLKQIQQQVVIFIDEIDSTLDLDFRDDFFAGIRSIYNARAENPDLTRATFVLLGVVLPTELISGKARTPLNIGQSISLQDFSIKDAHVLRDGLDKIYPGDGQGILDRIFFWTNGHPYLTQKLCSDIFESKKPKWSKNDVDNLVKVSFLSEQSRKETNFSYIEDRILKDEDRIELLKLYRTILGNWIINKIPGNQITDDGKSKLQRILKLLGLVRSEKGILVVRNRIYQTVFSSTWISEIFPRQDNRPPFNYDQFLPSGYPSRSLKDILIGLIVFGILTIIVIWSAFIGLLIPPSILEWLNNSPDPQQAMIAFGTLTSALLLVLMRGLVAIPFLQRYIPDTEQSRRYVAGLPLWIMGLLISLSLIGLLRVFPTCEPPTALAFNIIGKDDILLPSETLSVKPGEVLYITANSIENRERLHCQWQYAGDAFSNRLGTTQGCNIKVGFSPKPGQGLLTVLASNNFCVKSSTFSLSVKVEQSQ